MLKVIKGTIGAVALSFLYADCAQAWKIESGTVTLLNTFNTPTYTSVSFQTPFDVTPVVVALPTNQGGDPSDLKFRNITTTGFEVVQVEPRRNDGPHIPMGIHYVAMEPGTGILPDGTQVAAGIHTTSTQQAAPDVGVVTGWDTVSFGTTLDSNAVVIADIQTSNSESRAIPGTYSAPFLSVAIQSTSPTDVQLALERSEQTEGAVSNEDIGWIAFPDGYSGDFEDTSNSTIQWDSRKTANSVVGWNDGCTNHSFTSGSWPNARIVGTKNSRDDNNGGWVRRCNLNNSQIGLVIDEDRSLDNERNHPAETVGLLSFSNSFHANFRGIIAANKTVSMPSYALPGNEVTYAISAENSGNSYVDANSVTLIDELPPEVSLKVTDLASPGSGPVNFIDGSPTSNLSYTFSGLSSTTDDVDFSNDGGTTYTYVPSAGANGADSNVTHIRINPKNGFAGNTGSGNPSFTVEFDTIIK